MICVVVTILVFVLDKYTVYIYREANCYLVGSEILHATSDLVGKRNETSIRQRSRWLVGVQHVVMICRMTLTQVVT